MFELIKSAYEDIYVSSLTKEIIKQQAKVLQEFIWLNNNKKLSLSTCYQCIAKMNGFESWNHFSKKLRLQDDNDGDDN